MNELTPHQAVAYLAEAGWSESRIAREAGTSQPTIHRLKHGKQLNVSFDVGLRLVRLAEAQIAVPPAANDPAPSKAGVA